MTMHATKTGSEAQLLARDAAVFFHQRNSTPVAHAIKGVEGVWAEDAAGKRFMDFHGNTCHNIGYRHPDLIAALHDQLDGLTFCTRGFTNGPAVALAERLAAIWPYGPARVLFGLSGTDAIEIALKLAFVNTGRQKTLAFEGAWHGAGLGALWVGGRASERVGFPVVNGAHHVPGYWSAGGDENGARRTLEHIRECLGREGGYACLLAEPLAGPASRPPDWFWPEVERLCRRNGTLLIFDEIPKALGKTGRMFASEHWAVRPDISVLGKSLGGAVVPLSAVIARADLNAAAERAIGHYTHQKSPFLARAGLTVLEIIERDGLCAAAVTKGAFLDAGIAALIERFTQLRRCDSLGLLAEISLRSPEAGPALREACYRRGLHVGGTRDGIELSPPLTVSESELELAIEILGEAIADIGRSDRQRP